MMNINYVELWLEIEIKINEDVSDKIRGYIGNKFIDDSLFHNHKIDGKNIYRYPIVQYKVINGKPLIIGINEGINSSWKIFMDLSELNLNKKDYEIFDKKSLLKKVNFGNSLSPLSYSFLTPWLALNENNYEKYQKIGSDEKRKELLEKILVGNILSMSKSLDYTVTEPIVVNIKEIREVQTNFKGNPMLSFIGTFEVNFNIPDLWGIGKSVSRGFGTIKKVS